MEMLRYKIRKKWREKDRSSQGPESQQKQGWSNEIKSEKERGTQKVPIKEILQTLGESVARFLQSDHHPALCLLVFWNRILDKTILLILRT